MTIDTSLFPRSAQAGLEVAALAPFYQDWRWSGIDRGGRHGPWLASDDRCRPRPLPAGPGWPLVRLRLRAGTAPSRWHLRAALAVRVGHRLGCSGWRVPGQQRRQPGPQPGPRIVAAWRETGWSTSRSGRAPRIRLRWLLDDNAHCRWRNELTLDGVTWSLVGGGGDGGVEVRSTERRARAALCPGRQGPAVRKAPSGSRDLGTAHVRREVDTPYAAAGCSGAARWNSSVMLARR